MVTRRKTEVVITNKDFGLEPVEFTEGTFVRYAARGILLDPTTGKIAMVCKKKINEYKLPGGGREGNETEEENFYREIMEETGCTAKIIKKLGEVKEERSSLNMKQISAVFVAEVVENTGEIHPDEAEIAQGLVLEWMSVDDAIEAVKNSFDTVLGDEKRSTYSAHFVLRRDLSILEAYKATLN